MQGGADWAEGKNERPETKGRIPSGGVAFVKTCIDSIAYATALATALLAITLMRLAR